MEKHFKVTYYNRRHILTVRWFATQKAANRFYEKVTSYGRF